MLQNRYDISRLHAERYFEKLNNLKQNAGFKPDCAKLRKTYETATATFVNLKTVAKLIMTVDLTIDEETQIEARCFRMLQYAQVLKGVDEITKSSFISRIDIERMEIPQVTTLLKYIETKSIHHLELEKAVNIRMQLLQ